MTRLSPHDGQAGSDGDSGESHFGHVVLGGVSGERARAPASPGRRAVGSGVRSSQKLDSGASGIWRGLPAALRDRAVLIRPC
jgi:hypothetical protein